MGGGGKIESAISKAEKKGRKEQHAVRKKYVSAWKQRDHAALSAEVKAVVQTYESRSIQYFLSGTHNAWITKPASKSRGRGIRCFNSLTDILRYCDLDAAIP